MEYVLTLIGWQLSIMLAHPKIYPDLKLPTEDGIKAMLKEAHRRFREAIKKAKETKGSE